METTKQISGRGGFITRASRVIRNEGVQGLRRRFAERWHKYFGLVYHYLLMQPIWPELPLVKANADVTVQLVKADDSAAIRELMEIYGVPATEEGILNRLGEEELCFAGRVDGAMIAYVWVRYGGAVKEYGETLLNLRADEAYNHDVYVVPEQRGKNIYPAMKALISQRLARQYGKRKMLSYVRRENSASLNSSRKLGEMHIGWLGYVKLFGRRHRFVYRIRPRKL